MSEQLIILVPVDPHYRPDLGATKQTVMRLKPMLGQHDRVDVQFFDKPQFFNGMENFESVHCPGVSIPLDMEWWSDTMDKDFDGEGFFLRVIDSPCGIGPLTLNDLDYRSPAAFGVFAIEIANPSISFLTDADQAIIEKVLGCPLRQIFAHI